MGIELLSFPYVAQNSNCPHICINTSSQNLVSESSVAFWWPFLYCICKNPLCKYVLVLAPWLFQKGGSFILASLLCSKACFISSVLMKEPSKLSATTLFFINVIRTVIHLSMCFFWRADNAKNIYPVHVTDEQLLILKALTLYLAHFAFMSIKMHETSIITF